MGVRITGMDEWREILETLPERAKDKFGRIMGQAGLNIKKDWSARWSAMPHEHLPHLVRLSSFGYEVDERNFTFSVNVGVKSGRLQTRLASFIEFGTLTSRPHPAGEPALHAEVPRAIPYIEKAAEELLTKPT